MRICVLLAILSAITASGGHSQTATYEHSDYLPLVVGNTWVYQQEAKDSSDGLMGLSDAAYREVTISIDTTEVIGGETYYVFSSLPAETGAPPHCMVNKKVRWDGRRLMEHTGTGEISIFRFRANDGTYSIPETHGDTEVKVVGQLRDRTMPAGTPPVRIFDFSGSDGYDDWLAQYEGNSSSRKVKFVAGFGMGYCEEVLSAFDYDVATNVLYAVRATLLEPATDDDDGPVGKSAPPRASGPKVTGTSSPDTIETSYWDAQFPSSDSE